MSELYFLRTMKFKCSNPQYATKPDDRVLLYAAAEDGVGKGDVGGGRSVKENSYSSRNCQFLLRIQAQLGELGTVNFLNSGLLAED